MTCAPLDDRRRVKLARKTDDDNLLLAEVIEILRNEEATGGMDAAELLQSFRARCSEGDEGACQVLKHYDSEL